MHENKKVLDLKCMLWQMAVVIYVISLFIILRYNVNYLKIQISMNHSDRDWKYHEWEIATIKADGVNLDVQEAYPDIQYACLKYFPELKIQNITIQNNDWIKNGDKECPVIIALGNTMVYSASVPVEGEQLRLDKLDSVLARIKLIYYIYYVILCLFCLTGAVFGIILFKTYKNVLKQWMLNVYNLAENYVNICKQWVGIVVIYLAGCFIALKKGNFFQDQQGFLPILEWCVFIGAILFLYGVCYGLLKSKKSSFLVVLAVSVSLFLSLHQITLYQTKDEQNNIKELMWLSKDVFRHWSFVNARTHYLLMGTIWKLLPEKYAMTGIIPIHMNSFQTAKVFHWSTGFFVTIGIIIWIFKRLLPQRKNCSVWYFFCGCFMIFSLPVWDLGMKMYNYDLFSMLFCVWGVVAGIDYLLSDKDICKMWSLLCMGLALQEKEFVIVYMLAIMVIMLAHDLNRMRQHLILKVLSDVLIIYLTPLIPIVFTDFWVSIVLRGGNRALESIRRCLVSYTECPKIVIDKVGFNCNDVTIFIITGAGMLAGGILCYLAYHLYKCYYDKIEIKIIIVKVMLILYILLLCVSVVFTYRKEMIPEESKGYFLLANIYGYAGYVPTVYFLIAGLLLMLLIFRRKAVLKLQEEEINLCMIAAMILGGLTWVNILLGSFQNALEILEYRYQNIQQMLNIVCIWVLICILAEYKDLLISLFAYACVIIEIVPSVPGFIIFYPFWNRSIYKEEFLMEDDVGMGNGMAGEMIEKYCLENHISFEGAHFYSSNYTPWGDNNYGIKCEYLKYAVEGKTCELDNNDFYVVFSNSISENNVQVVIPEDIEPVMNIKYRDIERCWIYRGDQLRDCYPFDEW